MSLTFPFFNTQIFVLELIREFFYIRLGGENRTPNTTQTNNAIKCLCGLTLNHCVIIKLFLILYMCIYYIICMFLIYINVAIDMALYFLHTAT